MNDTFTALVIDQDDDGKAFASLRELTLADLPDDDVLVHVEYSGLNYKDGLAISGNRNKVVRSFPMVGGADLAGTVVESRSPLWTTGDRVVLNGFGLTETHWGGFTRYQRVRAEWLVRIPDEFSALQAMGIGTAGYTAALCVDAIERWGSAVPGDGTVLVTGAAGGVGSVAVALLSAAGYHVTASTGRPETRPYLERLGATDFVDRSELQEPGGPLQKERWSAVVDSVGSTTLVNAIAQTARGGAVTACGLAGGADLNGTVLPHILRGVALIGIDSVFATLDARRSAWERLARDLDAAVIDEITTVEPMSELPRLAGEILNGQVRGRIAIDVTR